jgi:hypothetical protein
VHQLHGISIGKWRVTELGTPYDPAIYLNHHGSGIESEMMQ